MLRIRKRNIEYISHALQCHNMAAIIRRRLKGKRTPQILLAFTIISFFIWNHWNTSIIKSSNEMENDIQVFELRSGKAHPSHLDQINPLTDLKSIGFQGLDSAHRDGMIHLGAWIHVIDSSLSHDPRLLLLKRGEDLVTCPNSWGLVGEHAYRDEPPIETVRRALLEELGSQCLHHVDAHGSIRNLTEFPVYYERDYGANNGNRIDRQITYIWLVEMNLDSHQEADKMLELDHEVADHMWMSLDEYEQWVESDTSLKDFCHETITSLIRLGIERLKILTKTNENHPK
eukprot:1005889_1